MAGASARATALGARAVSTSVWYGPPAWAIAEAVRLYRVDLVVMTSHGRSGLGRLVLGSVAETVLRSTRTPILLLRDAEAPIASLPAGMPAPTRVDSNPREDTR